MIKWRSVCRAIACMALILAAMPSDVVRGGIRIVGHGGHVPAPPPPAPSPCTDPTPLQAAAVGYTMEVFCSGGGTIPTVDSGNTRQAGFTWYWNNGAYGGTGYHTTGSDYSVDNTTGAITTQAAAAIPSAWWVLNTCAIDPSIAAIQRPFVGHPFVGGFTPRRR
jgi:hypothetical protein